MAAVARGSAAVMGLVGLAVSLRPEHAVVIFAILTIVTTLAGRRFFPRRPTGGDINDTRIAPGGPGRRGGGDFQGGQGRVFVDGKEWAAELEGAGALLSGMKVIVVAVQGACLTVRPG